MEKSQVLNIFELSMFLDIDVWQIEKILVAERKKYQANHEFHEIEEEQFEEPSVEDELEDDVQTIENEIEEEIVHEEEPSQESIESENLEEIERHIIVKIDENVMYSNDLLATELSIDVWRVAEIISYITSKIIDKLITDHDISNPKRVLKNIILSNPWIEDDWIMEINQNFTVTYIHFLLREDLFSWGLHL